MIHGRYRTNYQGEFVLLDTVFRGGKKIQQREYIANPIHNQHISGMAAVIGSGISAKIGVVKLLPRHRGGLLGKKKLQTYAAQGVWRTMRVDFCVENSQIELQDMLEQKYTAHTVVYTRVKNCMAMPGSFYIVPYGVRLVPMGQAVYLAAFDVLGSLAHIEMLESVGLLTKDELTQLQAALKDIYKFFKFFTTRG